MHFEMPVPFTRSNRFDFAQVLSSGWVSVGNESNYSPFFHEKIWSIWQYLTVKETRVNIVKTCQIMWRSLCLSCFRAICLATLKLPVAREGYRELYDHILLSGGRRFVVTSVDPESQAELRLAQAAVVFYLDDLEEVSETLVGCWEVYHCTAGCGFTCGFV